MALGKVGGNVSVSDTGAVGRILPDYAHDSPSVLSGFAAPQRSISEEERLMAKLVSRMDWLIIKSIPFKRVVPVRVSEEKMVLFVVTKTDALIIEDDPYLYPSDTLITQLRLLEAAQ